MQNNQLKMIAVLCTLSFLYCSQIITISPPELEKAYAQDTTPPIISFGNDTIFIASGEPYTYQTATAWDLVDGSVPVTYSGTVDITKTGTYLIVYVANDKSNNTTTRIKTVIVRALSEKDTIKPVFSIAGNDTVSIAIGINFEKNLDDFMKSVKATDNIQGDISDLINITSSISSLVPKINTVTFSVSDNDGNITTITRYVDVYEPAIKDEIPPKINFGNDTVTLMVGDVYTEIKATAWDNVDGDVPVSSTGRVNTGKAGTYHITYTATDKANNIATRIKIVIVEAWMNNDLVTPELTLKGKDTIYVSTFTQFVEPGFSAVDNYDGVITSKVKIDYGQFQPGASAGLYQIKYAVQDIAGNSTTKTRYICLNCQSTGVKKLH